MAKAKTAAKQEPRQTELEITVDEVRVLEIGNRVNIHGEDSDGKHRVLECTVAGMPGRKFLTYRDPHGSIRRCAIKDYPGKYYTKVFGG